MAGTTAQLDFAQLGTFVIAGDQTWEDAFDAADRCIGGVGRVLPRPRVDSAAAVKSRPLEARVSRQARRPRQGRRASTASAP
jgi:hypothetical protein